jgi:hypothetical protein
MLCVYVIRTINIYHGMFCIPRSNTGLPTWNVDPYYPHILVLLPSGKIFRGRARYIMVMVGNLDPSIDHAV